MSEFAKNISTFFRSDCQDYNTFTKVLKESTVQEEWYAAVDLYRKGIFALQKNDLKGLDIIKKANESLKKVVSTSETMQLNLNALNESLIAVEKDIPNNIQLVKYNFGMLYETCKKEGMKAVLNEATFYEEEDGNVDIEESVNDEVSQQETPEDADAEAKEIATDNTLTETTPVDNTPGSTVAIEPSKIESSEPVTPPAPSTTTPTPAPELPKESPKSGYAEGFEAGKNWVQSLSEKFGCKNGIKEAVKQKIVTELHSQPYGYVKKWEEGFAAGAMHAEEVNKEIHAEEYKKYSESQTSN